MDMNTPEQQKTSDDLPSLIIRIDERTKNFSSEMAGVKSEVSEMGKKISTIETKVTEFNLVKTVVFGGVGLVLIAIITAIIGLILIKPT